MMSCTRIFNLRATVLFTLLLWSAGGAAAEPIRIVALGDSLTAGYRLKAKDAFPAQLQRALRARGHDVTVANAGVSGDTSAGGLARLDWAVPNNADAVILELGGNDALRGIDPVKTYEALTKIIHKLKNRGIHVLIAGMKAPPNMGREYVETFNRIYPYLSETHGMLLYPFILDGVAGNPRLNQRDGIHPTAKGIAIIVKRILPSVEKLIERVRLTNS